MNMSLKKKLKIFVFVTIVPMAVLIIILLFTMNGYRSRYDQIVKNITTANAYNNTFKKDIDYTMYQVLVGVVVIGEENPKRDIVNPYETLEELDATFYNLYQITTVESNKKRIKSIHKLSNTLRERIKEMEINTKEPGHYDENKENLEMNIRILTELIQEKIQECIFYEAQSLETTRQELAKEFSFTWKMSLISFGLVLLITYFLSKVITLSITRPIQALCETTKLVGEGDFTIRASKNTGDEVRELTNSFNGMIEKIGNLVEDVKMEQLNLRATELKLLQAQINPHFLYNTLDTIIWLAESNQTDQVAAMVTSLSDFFRTTLSKGQDDIPISEEEKHIRSYLQIQQFRYQDILEYEIQMDPEIRSCRILKLTLQPLVENALYHGIKNKRGKGKILVRGHKESDRIVLTVSDNGIGMDEETLEKLRKVIKGELRLPGNSGFGLANVDERIRLNYGDSYGLSIESTYGEGSIATVTIPIITMITL